jgi:hypothetical protein
LRAAPGAAHEMSVEHKLLLLQSVTKVWLQFPKLDKVSLMQKLPSFWASFRLHFDLGFPEPYENGNFETFEPL